MATTMANPKDSMKSTWRRQDKKDWSFWGRLYAKEDIFPDFLDSPPPKFEKTDPIPALSDWQTHRWVVFHAAIPLVLHQAYVWYFGKNIGPVAAFFLYTYAFRWIAARELHMLRALGQMYGFLDGDTHDRDGIPDVAIGKVIRSLLSTAFFRPMFTVALAYRRAQTPAEMDFYWLPIEIGLYGIVLDFWFYWYHRLMHDTNALWKYHRTHHLTKHPNPLLSLYADTEQEIFDIAVIPILAWGTLKAVGLPMSFYEWWVCHQFVAFAELAGHSGLRLVANPPSPFNWLLRFFGVELTIEDHDLHHRQGWKKSANYGKQTRLWDTVFGTVKDRIESERIDPNEVVKIPLFGLPAGPVYLSEKRKGREDVTQS